MMHWKLVTLFVCCYGFIREFRPGVPFLTPFLISEPKNFTGAQLYSQVYPFWTYSYMVSLIPVFFLTDLLHYKPVIILEACSLVCTWCLLIFGQTLPLMQLMQVVYGIATASEVAYYAYIYAAVDDKHYKKVTSYVRGAALAGKCLAYTVGQILLYTTWGDYFLLNYISLACLCVILCIAVLLPRPRKAAIPPIEEAKELLTKKDKQRLNGCHYFSDIWLAFRDSYSIAFVLKWSVWWALASCGYYQVGNYIQNLWVVMQSHGQADVHNGIAEALNTLSGAGVALSMQFVHLNWPVLGDNVLALLSLIGASLLALLSFTNSLIAAYLLYICYCSLYQMLITIATYNVAKNLDSCSYALVFGFNTFVAIVLQAALTFAVTDKNGFALQIRPQFVVYSIFHCVIGLIFLAMGLFGMFKMGLLSYWRAAKVRDGPLREKDISEDKDVDQNVDA